MQILVEACCLADNEGFNPRERRVIRHEIIRNLKRSRKPDMSIVVTVKPRLQTVSVTNDLISASLTDGRTITAPPSHRLGASQTHPLA
jgi:hypothetical protein